MSTTTATTSVSIPPEAQTELHFTYRGFDEPSLIWTCEGSEEEVLFGALFTPNSADDTQPRHRHVMDQLRYVTAGSMTYGRNRTAQAGDLVYFPESVHYGPMEWGQGEHFAVQWPGPSEHGRFFPHSDGVRAADEMREHGEFDLSTGGTYVYADGRRQDSYEAIFQHLSGSVPDYRGARYRDQICVRTTQVRPEPLVGSPGVSVRHLGHFTERGPNVKQVSMEAGAVLAPRRVASQQLLAVLDGTIEHSGDVLPRRSYVYSPPGSDRLPIRAVERSEILAVHLRTATGPAIESSEI